MIQYVLKYKFNTTKKLFKMEFINVSFQCNSARY